MAHTEDKNKEVKRIEIEKAEEGYIYKVHVENKKDKDMDMPYMCECLTYAYPDVDTVLAAVQDDLESPHARSGKKAPLGEGGRFKALSSELEAKGAKDPDALAAYIGRKRYGSEKFAKLALKGRKG